MPYYYCSTTEGDPELCTLTRTRKTAPLHNNTVLFDRSPKPFKIISISFHNRRNTIYRCQDKITMPQAQTPKDRSI